MFHVEQTSQRTQVLRGQRFTWNIFCRFPIGRRLYSVTPSRATFGSVPSRLPPHTAKVTLLLEYYRFGTFRTRRLHAIFKNTPLTAYLRRPVYSPLPIPSGRWLFSFWWRFITFHFSFYVWFNTLFAKSFCFDF